MDEKTQAKPMDQKARRIGEVRTVDHHLQHIYRRRCPECGAEGEGVVVHHHGCKTGVAR